MSEQTAGANHIPIWLIMPTGATHGWGVCGKYLALEMSSLADLRFITNSIESEKKNDPALFSQLSRVCMTRERLQPLRDPGGCLHLDHPVLQAISGPELRPWEFGVRSPRTIGYTFFEKTALKQDDVASARGYYDMVVAGSTWCRDILREHGLEACAAVLQGVDTGRFHGGLSVKTRFKDRFVVFSGGKIEFRKGQDLVIRAFKALQDRHDDVLLANCWYNYWDGATATMSLSPHIRFEMPKGDYIRSVSHLLRVNGIRPENALILPPIPNARMGQIYRDTDCGLFPNRCEGGTNLVLMEYMACGKPVIGSFNSGQKDVLSSDHALLLNHQRSVNVMQPDGSLYALWSEPNLEEVVEKLEWAYHHREEIREIGEKGGKFISRFTWRRAAREFHALMIGTA
ncbi:MAG: glycosyltransferase [Desulfobacteraceae bacterium]|nr:MAG: glycosyltransferase [Desulfobacteraceae bacterium]